MHFATVGGVVRTCISTMAAADKNSATGEEELTKNKGAQDTNEGDYDDDEEYSDSEEEEEEEEEDSSSEEEVQEVQEEEAVEVQEEEAVEVKIRKAVEQGTRKLVAKKKPLTDAEMYDFPKDPENWTEEDLEEIWADAPPEIINDIGWDPDLVDDEDWELIETLREEGETVTTEPFYVPYRKYYPPILKTHHDINTPKSVVEELERLEEFFKWGSFVFKDGSTYEGTVWDDLAQGKGVFTTPMELCRYEGEWVQNTMQGHGVLEVHIPDKEPMPDSEHAKKMRAQGYILKSDYMSPEDREWLKMDIEDTEKRYGYRRRRPLYESRNWVKRFGKMPEKGLYRYAGQWKHSRMHGCGVYEVNRRLMWGKFYFGEPLSNPRECTAEISAMHAGLAEVAAAKARMFVNKPDGMVRELKGPHNDPQHPYMYEEEDLWMAPGFINMFYEVPDFWKRYVHDVDQEREMWLNSFYKSPLRIPMPAELEHWWSKDPEFMRIGNPKRKEDELLLHVPTGRLINWAKDSKGRVRLFWQPVRSDGKVKPEDVKFLPLGFDEFMGKTKEAPESEQEKLERLLEEEKRSIKEKFQKQIEEKNKELEEERKNIELEMKYIENQEKMEDAVEEMEYQFELKQIYDELKERVAQKEEPKEEPKDTSGPEDFEGGPSQGNEEAEEEEHNVDKKPRSFGTVAFAESQHFKENSYAKTDKNGWSLSSSPTLFASLSMVPQVAMHRFNPLVSWLKGKQLMPSTVGSLDSEDPSCGHWRTQNSRSIALKKYPKFINYPLSRNVVAKHKAVKVNQNHDCRTAILHSHCRKFASFPRVLSHTCKPKRSLKNHQDSQRRKWQQTTKHSNQPSSVTKDDIFSLSIPMEYLSCRSSEFDLSGSLSGGIYE